MSTIINSYPSMVCLSEMKQWNNTALLNYFLSCSVVTRNQLVTYIFIKMWMLWTSISSCGKLANYVVITPREYMLNKNCLIHLFLIFSLQKSSDLYFFLFGVFSFDITLPKNSILVEYLISGFILFDEQKSFFGFFPLVGTTFLVFSRPERLNHPLCSSYRNLNLP